MTKEIIAKRFEVSMKYHNGWHRPIDDIEEIVIHATPGKSATGLLNWMLKGERSGQYKKGIALFHFLIDPTGLVYQIAPINRWYYHSSSGKHDKVTIGIEILNSDVNNEGDFTGYQYEGLEHLIFDTLFRSCINIGRIVSHDYNNNTYSGNRKGCPGKNFDWDKIHNMFIMRNIDVLPIIFKDVIEFDPYIVSLGV